MSFDVFLTNAAARDLEDIHRYIAAHDARTKANRVLDRIGNAIRRLADHPERGSYPKELLAIGLRDFRETFFKPYRIIYRVIGGRVYVLMIADGRRDMQTLLQRRLLQSP